MFRSVVESYKSLNKPLLITALDISKYFDKHVLLEAQEVIAQAQIDNKCYRLLYKLNSNTTVQVKTPVGTTDLAVTGENLAQGSKSAGIICSLSLSTGMEKYFHNQNSQYPVYYGEIKVSSLLYQNDSFELSSSVEGARDSVFRFQKLMESKRLQINLDKSAVMIMGKKKVVDQIREEINKNPVTYNNVKLKEKKEDKWLGDVVSVAGNKASTLASIRERKGRLVNAIFETIAIIEDSRVNKLGARDFAKNVWEMALVPSLLNSSEISSVLEKEVHEKLEGL